MDEVMKKIKKLPEQTIGRAGCDLFSSRKDLTVVMIPFERFSPFAKAVDDLYAAIDVPFNLIVVEGNAPDSVRAQLEKRQVKHKNMAILYSDRRVSIGSAINLAAPHLTTPYVFIMDNDVRFPKGTMSKMVRHAKENSPRIICPQNYGVSGSASSPRKASDKAAASLGIRTSFLTSVEILHRLGKFDENASPFTIGIDLRMGADELEIPIDYETEPVTVDQQPLLWPMDLPLHSFQWDEQRIYRSVACLEEKWGIALPEQDYILWLERKKRDHAESKNIFSFLGHLLSDFAYSGREKESKDQHYFSMPHAA